MESKNEIKFSQLLSEAVTKPGIIGKHYSSFHRYSLGNQIAAIFQCYAQDIETGPIASFMAWKEKGRSVKKGMKAIELCMPITRKCSKANEETGEKEEYTFQSFVWKKNWFVLAQTQGAEYVEETVCPAWDRKQAIDKLNISEVSFTMLDGNCQGYACKKEIAISPLAAFPVKTTIHEIAHIVLGHTSENTMSDSETTPRNIREVEAEGVAYILTDLLDLPGKDESRGYIQSWLQNGTIPEKSAQKIFHAADTILKAGN